MSSDPKRPKSKCGKSRRRRATCRFGRLRIPDPFDAVVLLNSGHVILRMVDAASAILSNS